MSEIEGLLRTYASILFSVFLFRGTILTSPHNFLFLIESGITGIGAAFPSVAS